MPLPKHRPLTAAALGAALLLAPTAARTQTAPAPPVAEPPAARREPPHHRGPVSLLEVVTVESVDVRATVRDGGIAETEVSQTFRNRTGTAQEADFLFPVPDGATVSSFAMYDGEKKLDARLLDRDEATRTYEEIVRRRRDPALLTFQGRAALRARVFPVPPNGERRVTLKLVTVLPREGDARKYAWTLVGPHQPGGAKTPAQVSVRVTVTGTRSVGNVYSPTHDVSLRRDAENKVVASWTSAGDKSGTGALALTENPEFDLYIAPAKGQQAVALSAITYHPDGGAGTQVASVAGGAGGVAGTPVPRPGYFLVVASPTLPLDARTAPPRRVVLVMDRSGSMQGKKMEQARGALRYALGRLRPRDRFNVLTFSDKVERFSPEVLAATPENVKKAQAFVDDIEAEGGTNIHDALKAGLEQFPERAAGNTLLFFTDGLPTVGVRDTNAIVRDAVTANEKKARTFVFGVGYDVDVPFLDRVSTALRGDADYVRPDEDIEAKTSRFVAKTAAPALENLRLVVEGANAGEVYPRPDDLPDLFAGGQMVIVGRYAAAGATGARDVRVRLTGEANGKPQTYELTTRFPAVDTEAAFLPRLWASRKIGHLMDEVRLREDADVRREMTEQIVALSKEYGILTPYTALFVPEPVDANGPAPLSVRREMRGRDATAVPQSSVFLGAGGFGGFGGARGGVADAAAPAPPPALKTGEAAVNLSQAARAQRMSAQVGNAQTVAGQGGLDLRVGRQMAQQIRSVAARTFYQQGATWTDARFDPAQQKEVVKVKEFSPAYFALTRRNADLAKWAALGGRVVVAVNATQAVQFGPDGREMLTDAEVAALAGK